jgi:quercetin dioxygenase-like cupin family protein
MPVIIRAKDHKLETSRVGTDFVQLLGPDTIGNDQIVLEYIKISAGTKYLITLDSTMVGWVQILSGQGIFVNEVNILTPNIFSYLPLGFMDTFVGGESGAILLLASVPRAKRFDNDIIDMPKVLRHIDWTREPILESEHDARKRVYLATFNLAGTNAFKGEMITYPPGAAAPEHYHVGAEHFQYILSGRVTALLDGTRHFLESGDVLYNYENERHTFVNESDSDFVFVEFFVPGPCETVWSPGANVCAWLPTGIDSKGRKPIREISYHIHGQDENL